MPNHEFGIIGKVDDNKKYDSYEPEKYSCVSVDDEIIFKIIEEMKCLKTYHHSLSRVSFGLAYYGVTLIPPESLKELITIIEKNIFQNNEVNTLLTILKYGLEKNKYIIHYGV